MNSASTLEQLHTTGHVVVEFEVPASDRRTFAMIGNQVIDIAMENEIVFNALNFSPAPNTPGHDTTTFAISEPRVSLDDSLWFHSGWQTKDRIEAELSRSKRPRLLDDFVEIQRYMLDEVKMGWLEFFRQIDEEADRPGSINELLSHQDLNKNNHHLRVVRYRNLSQYNDENGTFSAHGDLGVVTTQFYQTHDGHLRITPYPLEKVADTVDEERYKHARSLHDQAVIASYEVDHEALTFLGFGAANVRNKDGSPTFQGLRAGYHYGVPPKIEMPLDEAIAGDFGDDIRVTAVAFGHPHYETPYTRYRTSTKQACRPEQVYEGKIKS